MLSLTLSVLFSVKYFVYPQIKIAGISPVLISVSFILFVNSPQITSIAAAAATDSEVIPAAAKESPW